MTASAFDIELDALTLARAKRGDMDACGQIFSAFHTAAWSVAMRMCQCREMAHEVTQEAFITAFSRLSQYRGDAPFWGWMRRVVINHALSALRRLPKSTIVELEDHHAHMEGHQEAMGDSMDLDTALATLSSEDRAVVWMHDVEGYNHEEIGQFFGKTESFSKTRLSRARAKLRDLLKVTSESGQASQAAS